MGMGRGCFLVEVVFESFLCIAFYVVGLSIFYRGIWVVYYSVYYGYFKIYKEILEVIVRGNIIFFVKEK